MRPSTVQSLYLRRLKLLSREPGAMAQFGFSPSYAATQPVVLPKPVVITLEQLASATAWRAGRSCLARRNCLNRPMLVIHVPRHTLCRNRCIKRIVS